MKYRLSQLAELVGGRIDGDPDRSIEGIATLEVAGSKHLSFVTNPRYRAEAAASGAGAILAEHPLEGVDKDFLLAPNPYHALAQIMGVVYPRQRLAPGVHETAIVEDRAEIDPGAAVGPYVVVGTGATIGPGVELHSHVVIGRGCVIGRDSILYPRVVLYDGTLVGERCILHSGVVLGSDGFGYALYENTHVKLEHAGRVVLEDDVEVGANTTVDRALIDETRIGAGAKIDNLVQVAHNVRIGRRCLLISQSGIAGSSLLGDGVILAGQAGIAGHLKLGDGVQVAAKSAVFKSVAAGRKVGGIPAGDFTAWGRQQAMLARLGEMKKRLEQLEQQVSAAEKGDESES